MEMDLLATLERPRFRIETGRLGGIWRAAYRCCSVRVPTVHRARDIERRNRCRFDLLLFALTYFPHAFWDPVSFQLEFVQELQEMILSGVKCHKAIAAPRGLGKSTIIMIAAIWAAFYGHSDFTGFYCVNLDKARERIGTIKNEIFKNDLLYEDFPEICAPVREFNGDARASHPYCWASDLISIAGDRWILGMGMTGGVVGTNVHNKRLKLVFIDDPEDIESAANPELCTKCENNINGEIGFLGGLGQPCAYVLITTIRNKTCASARLTDPAIYPDWGGVRYRAMITPPERLDMWDTYVGLCKSDGMEVNAQTLQFVGESEARYELGIEENAWARVKLGRRWAFRYFVGNKDEMMRGVVMLDNKRLPLHDYYSEVARIGPEQVAMQLQNDPLPDPENEVQRLDVGRVMRQQDERIEGWIVPLWAAFLTAFADIGLGRFHWCVVAWSEDGKTGHLVECGIQETNYNEGGRWDLAQGNDVAKSLIRDEVIAEALAKLDVRFAAGWPDELGVVRQLMYAGVDIGGTAAGDAWDDVVFKFTHARRPRWVAMKGASVWNESTVAKAGGRNWYYENAVRETVYQRLDWNTMEFKSRLFNMYQTPVYDEKGNRVRGSMSLHRSDARQGKGLDLFARHQVSEQLTFQFLEGKAGDKNRRAAWAPVNKHEKRFTHWWDAMAGNVCVADLTLVVRGWGVKAVPVPQAAEERKGLGFRVRERARW